MRLPSSAIQRCLRDERGAVAITFGLCISVILLCMVIAVDYGRAVSVSRKVTTALDAAALAGAKLLVSDDATDGEVIAGAEAYFAAQMDNMGVGNLVVSSLVTTLDRNASTVTTGASVAVESLFGKTVGITTINVEKTSTVVYKIKKIELAMALDVTGSMADVPAGDVRTKIESLQLASKDLVDTLFDKSVNESGVRIALAPYSGAVNVDARAAAVTAGALANGCVVERPGANNATNADASGADALVPMPAAGYCPVATIKPLAGRSQRASIKSAIDSFAPNGSTAGHLGTAWAWYMVSASWSSVFGGASAPSAPAPDVVKSVVVMTDGLFNTAYLSGFAPGSPEGSVESYDQFTALCTNMKASGVAIYSVLFGEGDPTAIAKMQACASTPSNYYTAANGAQLQAAFATIAERLSAIRVAQ